VRGPVSLQIDEFVLDGVAAGRGVEAEVRVELARLLADAPPSGGRSRSVVTEAVNDGAVGPAIANAIHRAVRS